MASSMDCEPWANWQLPLPEAVSALTARQSRSYADAGAPGLLKRADGIQKGLRSLGMPGFGGFC